MLVPRNIDEIDERVCRPTYHCTDCGCGIYVDDYYYEFLNEIICEDCMDSCKKTCTMSAEEMEEAV